ncbi:hypothetical protein F4780DRAFT_283750 [Xylariomycetidae sp. FL0641]|nr:hypothetical protein F4780DRAFT_283750 [Xylariomycetidae sp. FL0641]
MKLRTWLVASLVPCALALAPLVKRGTNDVIENSYIVVMKKGLDLQKLTAHYKVMADSLPKAASGKRGFVRSFQVHEFNAYHIECDEAALDEIRNNKMVDYIAQDGIVTVQAPIPLSNGTGDPYAPAMAPQGSWGLGRISHRKPGNGLYVDVNAPQSRAYIVDSGIRLSHVVS